MCTREKERVIISELRIIAMNPDPYADLRNRVDSLLAQHPQTDAITLRCLEIARVVRKIDASCPGYADEMFASVQQRLHLVQRR